MPKILEVKIPDIGDFEEVPVIEVMVKPGDTIKPEDPLITLESDKATMDVPSPAAGKVKDVKLKVGDKISQGSLILLLETAEATQAPAAPAKPAPKAEPVAAPKFEVHAAEPTPPARNAPIPGTATYTGKIDGECEVLVLGAGPGGYSAAFRAADLLKNDWGVTADIWSCPSFTLLARDGNECARSNLLHPTKSPRFSHVGECLKDTQGPVIASTDYVRAYAEQIRPFVPRRYTVLGTDGFGRSDTREKLRYFFEVDRHWVTLASLAALAEDGAIERQKVADAIKKYGIDPEKPNPLTV